MAGLRTVFPFRLPKGYVGADGVLHRDGEMRLATARDEIEPLRDRAITGPDDPYVTILVLARVITRLGSLESVTTTEIEGIFAADLAFLQDLYGIINFGDQADVEALQASVLPDDDVDHGNVVSNAAADDAADELAVAIGDDGSDELGSADIDPEVGKDAAVASARRARSRVEEIPRPSAAS